MADPALVGPVVPVYAWSSGRDLGSGSQATCGVHATGTLQYAVVTTTSLDSQAAFATVVASALVVYVLGRAPAQAFTDERSEI